MISHICASRLSSDLDALFLFGAILGTCLWVFDSVGIGNNKEALLQSALSILSLPVTQAAQQLHLMCLSCNPDINKTTIIFQETTKSMEVVVHSLIRWKPHLHAEVYIWLQKPVPSRPSQSHKNPISMPSYVCMYVRVPTVNICIIFQMWLALHANAL